jgi:hypothetical protein
MRIMGYSFKYYFQILKLLNQSYQHYPTHTGLGGVNELKLRFDKTIEQTKTGDSKILIAEKDKKVMGILIVHSFKSIYNGNQVWMEQIWYPDLNLNLREKVIVMKKLLSHFIDTTKGFLWFSLPAKSTLSKLLFKNGFIESETHYIKENK